MLSWFSNLGWLWVLVGPALVIAGLALFAVIGCATAFVYSFLFAPRFLFSRRPQTERFAKNPIPPQAVPAVVREIWTLMLFIGFYPFGRLVREFNTTPGQKVPPVILIHGYGVSTTSWYTFMRLLTRHGVRRPIYALGYNWLAAAEQSSQRLAELVDRALAEQGATQVDLVAHSWGGLVSRWYIERQGQGARVRRLIMLGTPLQGTWFSKFARGGPQREMRVGGPFLTSLATAPPAPPYATLWSECDQIITPPQLALLADAGANPVFRYRFSGIAHLTMQRDDRVAELVAALCENPSAWTKSRD